MLFTICLRSRRNELSLDLLSQLLSFALKRMRYAKGVSISNEMFILIVDIIKFYFIKNRKIN